MVNISYLPLVFQTITVIVSVVTILWRIQARSNDRYKNILLDARRELEAKIQAIENRVKKVEELRSQGDKGVHKRISEIEVGNLREVNERLSNIEGQLKGIIRISNLMQTWLVEYGGKTK